MIKEDDMMESVGDPSQPTFIAEMTPDCLNINRKLLRGITMRNAPRNVEH